MTLSRRRLLTSALALAGTACAGPSVQRASRKKYDLVLRGGTVFDGSGAPGVDADVGVLGGRIAFIGKLPDGDAREELDARGLAVAPGFVDLHSHADGRIFDEPSVESVLRQGITTVVVGQDGFSRGLGADSDDPKHAFPSLAKCFDALDALGPSVNVASMVGLGSVRGAVVGDSDRPATEAELAQMVARVGEALADGACGASSGLEYTPGSFASTQELTALCRPLRARGLVYATHLRNEDDRLLEAISEAIAVAQGAGCRLQISHLKTQGPRNWGKLPAAFELIERAHAGGLDVAFDRYPYVAYQTGLSNLFPAALRDGGTEAFLARLTASATAGKLRAAALEKVAGLGGWDNVMVSSVASAADRGAEGQRLGSYAAQLRADPYELTVGLLTRSKGDVGMVGFAMSEENLARILAHPLGMACSDGGAYAVSGPGRRGHPHPRALGSFPRVLARYVRETRALTLPQAIHKLSAFPASRAGLKDRGRISEGLAADLLVFDPATIQDGATFVEPFAYPKGIAAVIVNGQVALRGQTANARGAGKALRA